MCIIYLIQPSELVGTDRYKIGRSTCGDIARVKNGYRKGTRYIFILECKNNVDLEKKLIQEFNKKFELIAGAEYFKGDETNMKK